MNIYMLINTTLTHVSAPNQAIKGALVTLGLTKMQQKNTFSGENATED